MDGRNKREAMEEQRRRWMEDRQNTILQNEAYIHANSGRTVSTLPSSSVSSSKEAPRECRELADESDLLNKLTERITSQIRKDVTEELRNNLSGEDMRNAMAEKMDRFLEAELHTHTCKICFELMTGADHTPMLLFPCGHTFCRTCVNRHDSKKKSNCPYCRQKTDSIAVNQSLKDLIDTFASQREKIKDGKSKLNDIFGSHDNFAESSNSSIEKEENSYKMKLKANEMRRVILENQLQEDASALSKIKKRKKNISAATNHLRKERESVEEKMCLLQEEIGLIDVHLKEQELKLEETIGEESALNESVALVKMSLSSIESDMDKLRILSQSKI